MRKAFRIFCSACRKFKTPCRKHRKSVPEIHPLTLSFEKRAKEVPPSMTCFAYGERICPKGRRKFPPPAYLHAFRNITNDMLSGKITTFVLHFSHFS